MNSIEQVEKLIQRLPTIACGTNTAAAFWQRVDGAMELVWDGVRTEEELAETEVRYRDLEEMANRLGFPHPDSKKQEGLPLQLPATLGAGRVSPVVA